MKVKVLHINNAIVYVSEIIENEQFAIDRFGITYKELVDEILCIKSKKRRLEKLTVLAMHHENYPAEAILYNANKAPYLQNTNLHISISHSKDYAVIAYSENKLGVDIEKISKRVVPVAHKFCTPEEFALHKTELMLTKIWSAKEAIFKYFEKDIFDFSKDMEVQGCTSKEFETYTARASFNGEEYHMMLHSCTIGDNILTVAKRMNS